MGTKFDLLSSIILFPNAGTSVADNNLQHFFFLLGVL